MNCGEDPFGRRPITKFMPSDGCKRGILLLVVEWWYNFPEFLGYLGNFGLGPTGKVRGGTSHE